MRLHGPQPTDIRLMIPRRCLRAWRRIATTIAPRLAEIGIEPSNQNILAAVLEIVDMDLHPDTALPCMDPADPFGVTVDDELLDLLEPTPEQREAFWRRLELRPPAPGSAPVLPSFDMLDEAKRRFPDIYGKPETESDS